MNLYCIKCTKFTKHNTIKIKHEIDEKNLYSRCVVLTRVISTGVVLTGVAETNKGEIMLSSKCVVWDSKKNKIYSKTRSYWIIEQLRD